MRRILRIDERAIECCRSSASKAASFDGVGSSPSISRYATCATHLGCLSRLFISSHSISRYATCATHLGCLSRLFISSHSISRYATCATHLGG